MKERDSCEEKNYCDVVSHDTVYDANSTDKRRSICYAQ